MLLAVPLPQTTMTNSSLTGDRVDGIMSQTATLTGGNHDHRDRHWTTGDLLITQQTECNDRKYGCTTVHTNVNFPLKFGP